jgi:hypothetical protein
MTGAEGLNSQRLALEPPWLRIIGGWGKMQQIQDFCSIFPKYLYKYCASQAHSGLLAVSA